MRAGGPGQLRNGIGNACLGGVGVPAQTPGSAVCVALARTAEAGQALEFHGSHAVSGVGTENLFSFLFPMPLGMDPLQKRSL